jgi:hypothetical protein
VKRGKDRGNARSFDLQRNLWYEAPSPFCGGRLSPCDRAGSDVCDGGSRPDETHMPHKHQASSSAVALRVEHALASSESTIETVEANRIPGVLGLVSVPATAVSWCNGGSSRRRCRERRPSNSRATQTTSRNASDAVNMPWFLGVTEELWQCEPLQRLEIWGSPPSWQPEPRCHVSGTKRKSHLFTKARLDVLQFFLTDEPYVTHYVKTSHRGISQPNESM